MRSTIKDQRTSDTGVELGILERAVQEGIARTQDEAPVTLLIGFFTGECKQAYKCRCHSCSVEVAMAGVLGGLISTKFI